MTDQRVPNPPELARPVRPPEAIDPFTEIAIVGATPHPDYIYRMDAVTYRPGSGAVYHPLNPITSTDFTNAVEGFGRYLVATGITLFGDPPDVGKVANLFYLQSGGALQRCAREFPNTPWADLTPTGDGIHILPADTWMTRIVGPLYWLDQFMATYGYDPSEFHIFSVFRPFPYEFFVGGSIRVRDPDGTERTVVAKDRSLESCLGSDQGSRHASFEAIDVQWNNIISREVCDEWWASLSAYWRDVPRIAVPGVVPGNADYHSEIGYLWYPDDADRGNIHVDIRSSAFSAAWE